MTLPEPLRTTLDGLLQKTRLHNLRASSESLSHHYKKNEGLSTEEERLAYLAVRMPATYAAISRVLEELPFPIHSLLDIGSGPGTALWAVREKWPSLESATLVEKDPFFITLAKELGAEKAEWISQDARTLSAFPKRDLTLFSYSFGEFGTDEVIEKAWQATEKALVCIEPGTPKGFADILRVRTLLIEKGGYMIAPCPHQNLCPLVSTTSWCHFAARVERSFTHRYAKSASLGYEDEKFSYCIFSKNFYTIPHGRLLKDPERHTGHVRLHLCAQEGLETPIYSRRHKELYKQARKARWGDRWEI